VTSNFCRQKPEIALLLWAGTVATSFFTLAPALVGALMDQLHLSVADVGFISSTQLAGSALGNLLVLVYGRRLPVRTVLVVAGAVLAAFDWLTASSHNVLTIALCRLAAGLAGGASFAVVNALAARLPRPGVMFAALSITQMLSGVAGFIALPALLGAYGLAGAFGTLSGCSCLSALAAAFVARNGPVHVHELRRSLSVTPRSALLLLALFATYLGSTALWTYLERIGVAAGLGAQVISAGLSISMAAGVLGALGAGCLLLGLRSPDRALLASSVAIALSSGVLVLGSIPAAYCAALLGFNAAWSLVTPLYLARLACEECGDGRVLVAMLVISVGLIGGPTLGAGLVTAGGYAVLITACTALLAVAALLVLLATRMSPRWIRYGASSGVVFEVNS
jgi:predicted MFS family arabinose efflux permease